MTNPPLFLLLLLLLVIVLFVSIWYFTRNLGVVRVPVMTGASRESIFLRVLMRICPILIVAFLALGIVAPPLPTWKTVVVQSNVECDRDIIAVIDVSGSSDDPFSGESDEDALSVFDVSAMAWHKFASNRPTNCFGTVIFSGPGQSSRKQREYAILLNHGIRNADQLVLPLRGGIGSATALQQFAWGTRISEGLVVASRFFEKQATSNVHVVILISDLGNEKKDNEKALEEINKLLDKDVRIYIFGIDVSKYSDFFSELEPYIANKKVAYLSVSSEYDLTSAYKFVDAIEAAPAPIQKTKIATIDVANSWFFIAALILSIPWIVLRIGIRRVI